MRLAYSMRETAQKLIGCANLIPGVRSLYWWQGEICNDEELVLLMETTAELAETAVSKLRELHSYDVPKIIVLDPESCDPEYSRWLRASLV